jgi:hypothetical protein
MFSRLEVKASTGATRKGARDRAARRERPGSRATPCAMGSPAERVSLTKRLRSRSKCSRGILGPEAGNRSSRSWRIVRLTRNSRSCAFTQKSKTLAAFDRYERRALSKRDRALRALRLHWAARLREPPELVGPPRPEDRARRNLFIDSPVRLELSAILSA